MAENEQILKLTSSFDVRVESLAAYILANQRGKESDLIMSQLLVNPLGGDRRRTKNDVDRLRNRFFEMDNALQIDANRKGLYDFMPERLFLRLDEEYENPRKKTRAINEQRSEARKFLLPFDQALFHPKIEIEQKEQELNERFPAFIETLWGLDEFTDCLNEKQKLLLCYLLPQAQDVVGDWNFTGLVFEAVLQKPVDLSFTAPEVFASPTAKKAASELTLGEDTIVGESFQDDLPSLEIVIKGITLHELNEFLEGGSTRRLITDLLCSYFLPLDISYNLRIKVTEDALGFDLNNCVLGVNTLLN